MSLSDFGEIPFGLWGILFPISGIFTIRYRELEKIEMVRLTDNRYRLDHAVTATQKTILKAFGMDAGTVKHYATEISRILREGK